MDPGVHGDGERRGWASAIPALGATVAVAAVAWGLWAMGGLGLAVDWDDPLRWLARAPLEVAAAAVVRLVGLAAVGWIGLTSLVYLVAVVAGADRSSLDWLSIGPIRRVIDTLVAGSLLLSSFAPASAIASDAAPTSAGPAPETSTADVDPAYVPVPAGRDAPERADETEPTRTRPAAPFEPAPPEDTDAVVVTVSEGDHLWGLAERRVGEVLGRSPGDDEVAPYWAEVVAENRESIRSGDPDLIFPGEEIRLPPFSPRS